MHCSSFLRNAFHHTEVGSEQFVLLSPGTLKIYERLFVESLHRGFSSWLVDEWAKLGMDCQYEDEYIVISETHDQELGRGMYAIRTDGAPVALLAPHRYYDLGTGEIALELFMGANFRGMAMNTVDRHGKCLKDRKEWRPDMTRISPSVMTAFTNALLTVDVYTTIVHLHGFIFKKHPELAMQNMPIIVGSGGEYVSSEAMRMVTLLESYLHCDVAVFPDDYQELGGKKSQICKAVAKYRPEANVHVEVEFELRQQLVTNRALVQGLGFMMAACLPGSSDMV